MLKESLLESLNNFYKSIGGNPGIMLDKFFKELFWISWSYLCEIPKEIAGGSSWKKPWKISGDMFGEFLKEYLGQS